METRDQELWACALWIEKQHGRAGARFIGEKVKRLALEGDFVGVATWRAIADRYDMLVDGLADGARQ